VLDSITSGLMGVSSRDFFQSMPRRQGWQIGYNFYNARPQKFVTAKKSPKIFCDFRQLSTLIANISGKNQHIKNRKSSWSSTTPPTLGQETLAYFGPQTKKLLSLINVHPNGIFSGNYISALRGCCTMKFLYALVIDQRYLAHTPTGMGGPP